MVGQDKQKRFYNRETIAALNYEILQMSHTPFPFYAAQINTPFLISMIKANHNNVERLIKGIVSLLVEFLLAK